MHRLLSATAALVLLGACSSGGAGQNTCARPYVQGATLHVPAPTCDGGDAGCDLICQITCPPAPSPYVGLSGCSLTAQDGGAATDAAAVEVSCVYTPYPIDPVCS